MKELLIVCWDYTLNIKIHFDAEALLRILLFEMIGKVLVSDSCSKLEKKLT